MMSHRVKVGSQIKIDYVGLALHDCLPYTLDSSVLTSSAGSQTTPVESRPQRLVPGSALLLLGSLCPGWMESKAASSCHCPSVFPPSVPAVVYTSSVPTPREVDRETARCPLLPLPETSLRLFPEPHRWPWPCDRLPAAFPVYRYEHTDPKSAR